jgi:hypothetical protein
MIFLETSALDATNIEEAFSMAVQEIGKFEKNKATKKS